MAIDCYLAMTAAEIASCAQLPPGLGYMACQFSPDGTGLSDCPDSLPPGAMLILNDRLPVLGHDPNRVTAQLRELVETCKCGSILLDFERPGSKEAARIAAAVTNSLPCPVGVSALYARELGCPVFLPPVPLDTPLADYLSPWDGREIWLDAALDSMCITLTPEGANLSKSPPLTDSSPVHYDSSLHCRYQIQTGDEVCFAFHRRPDDLEALLEEADGLGVSCAVGLYQELGDIWT